MVKKIFGKEKRGLSPTITTVLLVILVIIIIGIIFLWFRGMVQEGVTKFGKNIQLVCGDVNFDASYSDGILTIANNGNIPLYLVNLRFTTGSNFVTKSITDVDAQGLWPKNGLNQGGIFSEQINVGNANKITVLPILIGKSSTGKKTFICEGEYGKDITF